jgi:hypothetical protein
MRQRLKDELEFAIWKITGLSIPYNEPLSPPFPGDCHEDGEDPGEVSMSLSHRKKNHLGRYAEPVPDEDALKEAIEYPLK